MCDKFATLRGLIEKGGASPCGLLWMFGEAPATQLVADTLRWPAGILDDRFGKATHRLLMRQALPHIVSHHEIKRGLAGGDVGTCPARPKASQYFAKSLRWLVVYRMAEFQKRPGAYWCARRLYLIAIGTLVIRQRDSLHLAATRKSSFAAPRVAPDAKVTCSGD
jgi:hypothetical protein